MLAKCFPVIESTSECDSNAGQISTTHFCGNPDNCYLDRGSPIVALRNDTAYAVSIVESTVRFCTGKWTIVLSCAVSIFFFFSFQGPWLINRLNVYVNFMMRSHQSFQEHKEIYILLKKRLNNIFCFVIIYCCHWAFTPSGGWILLCMNWTTYHWGASWCIVKLNS